MPEEFPEILKEQIEEIEIDLLKDAPVDTLEHAVLIDDYMKLPEIRLEDFRDCHVSYEDDNGITSLRPIANSPYGTICEKIPFNGSVEHVVVGGSMYIPGLDNHWRDVIANGNVLMQFMFGVVEANWALVNLNNSKSGIFAKGVCSDAYLLTSPIYIPELESYPQGAIIDETGYSIALPFYEFSTLSYDDNRYVYMKLLAKPTLSAERIKNAFVTDKYGQRMSLEDFNA